MEPHQTRKMLAKMLRNVPNDLECDAMGAKLTTWASKWFHRRFMTQILISFSKIAPLRDTNTNR